MSVPVILASTSAPRRKLLTQAGVCPTVRASWVDEPARLQAAAREEGHSLGQMPAERRVMVLSEAKASAVAQAYADQWEAVARAEASPSRPLVWIDRPLRGQTRRHSVERLLGKGGWLAGHPGLADLSRGPVVIGCDSLFEMGGQVYGKPHLPEVARRRLTDMRGKTGTLWTGHTLIDLKTGRREHAVSTAQLRFGDYSDQDIERYIATGEPLQVAGSFTLEGLGGAFIDSVIGDPHGIIGLSLPLVRRMAARLGYDWTDFWNVRFDADGEGFVDGDRRASLRSVGQPGDGWFDCACGHRHWGLNGAAGILLARRDPRTGRVTDVALQHRVSWSLEGGTWGTPGGALSQFEDPVEGALRESFEEASIAPSDIDIVGAHVEDHEPWAYTTLFAFERPGHRVTPRIGDNESTEVRWQPVEKVLDLPLLSYFRADWPEYEQTLQDLARRIPLR